MPSKVGEQELVTVFANSNYFLLMMLSNAAIIIWLLLKAIFNSEKKKLDEIKAAVALIPALASKVNDIDDHLKENVPTHDQVELKILRAINKDRPL